MERSAAPDFEIAEVLRRRWSPRAFDTRSVPPETIRSLLEAARWAPSSMNEQPWHFIVARREDAEDFQRLGACLTGDNQKWAPQAPVLLLSVARSSFVRNERPNRHALHDVGLAVGQLLAQATSLGLVAHQMGGFDPQRARESLRIPAGFEPVAAIAIGYPGDPKQLDDALRERELGPRLRRPQNEFVFGARWGDPLILPSEAEPERVLSFWLGELDEHGLASAEQSGRWWKRDAAFDQLIREQFEAEHAAIVAGERQAWLRSARGRLAYVIVLDQFSRNMYRGTPRMFATDDQALRAAQGGIERGFDRSLSVAARAFMYLPLMHSEDVEVQEICVEQFTALRDELTGPARAHVERNLKFAVQHRDIVALFGRFPHRNAVLGRESTPQELEFLKQPGSSF
jgi:uncharacterized protein (DUF924 family)/nitroreductase